MKQKRDSAAAAVEELITSLGLARATPELRGTPERVARLFREAITSGYAVDVPALLASHVLRARSRTRVVLHEVPVATMCPHHLMPAWGTVTVGFQPNEKLLGLGVVSDAVHALARRLALQEAITEDIVVAIADAIDPTWVACRMKLVHGCMVVASPTAQQTHVETYASRGDVPAEATWARGRARKKRST